MRVLVLGANSFSGTWMCRYLLEQGCDVIGTWAHRPPEELEGITWERLNLLHQDSIRAVLEAHRPERIFNFSNLSSVGKAWQNPGETVEVNVNGAINLFEAIRSAAISPTTVLIGAGEEYGRIPFDRMPVRETENAHPANIYAASMACQTMMARIYCKAYGMRLIIARIFNVIGPGQADRFVVSDFCRQGVECERADETGIIHVGNINAQRDFTDIRDLVRAFWLLSEKGRAGEIYNVGTGRAVSIRDVLECIREHLNTDVTLQVDKDRLRPLDCPKLEGSTEKLKNDTLWEPEISLEQSVTDILDYWRTHCK